MDSILSVFVGEKTESVPVSCLPSASCVLVGEKAQVDVFSREFELIHEDAWVALVNSDLLISVDSNQGKADLLDVNVVNRGMGKDVVCVQVNGGNSGVVKSAVCVHWEVVIFVPGVSNSKTA